MRAPTPRTYNNKGLVMTMRKPASIRRFSSGAFILVVVLALLLGAPPGRAQTIPADARIMCPVTAADFANWFKTGSPSVSGVVNPADSVNFPNHANCSFYEWSLQMFLWLTSPTPLEYGGGGRIFNSRSFFDVSPPDSGGNRHFIAHAAGISPIFHLTGGFVGPHGLPVIFSKTRQMLEVEPTPIGPKGSPLVLNRAGQAVEIGRIAKNEDGKAIFFDSAGVRIAGAVLLSQRRVDDTKAVPARIVQKFAIKQTIFVDLFANVVEVEQGQSVSSAVLMSQNCSLVYYGISVNDVYAYFLTGVKGGAITPGTTFPTTAADLAQITGFAASHGGVTFPDPNALAIVVKTAWVEASTLPNPGDYVTMSATVPAYSPDGTGPCQKSPTNPTTLAANGQKTVQLALVSIHVVGSAAGNPEMIWATFEHFGNTPNDQFSYFNPSNLKVMVPRATAGNWLFSAPNAAGPFNVQRMSFDPNTGNIIATGGNTIGPSNTLRSKPWGGSIDQTPNPIVAPWEAGDSSTSNTEVISINNSVLGMMLPGDVRANYFLTGATWTAAGHPPVLQGDPASVNWPPGFAVGTSQLENSVLETYFQGDPHWGTGLNCFDCHSNGNSLNPADPNGLSHIFSVLAPLKTP
jgi:hypothetical protein